MRFSAIGQYQELLEVGLTFVIKFLYLCKGSLTLISTFLSVVVLLTSRHLIPSC